MAIIETDLLTPVPSPTSNPVDKALANNPFTAPDLRYPHDLGSPGQEPYIIFDIREPVAREAKHLKTIAMYMPVEIRTAYSASYDNPQIHMNKYIHGWHTITSRITDLFGGGDPARAAAQAGWDYTRLMTAQALDSKTGLNAAAWEEMRQGVIPNPHAAVVFRGIGFRQFEFNFTFMARNQAESETIRQIIYQFKYHMHPATVGSDGKASSLFWHYPDNFVIGLFSPEDKYLFGISACVLKDMKVDYAGSQVPVFFKKTGAPVDIRMTLVFEEMESLTKERIMEGY